MRERTDQEWIRQLKQEDPQAIHDLWVMLWTYAKCIARRYSQGYDTMIVENIVHEATLQAYQRILKRGVYQFLFKCPFPGYCRVTVVNEVRRAFGRLPKSQIPLDYEIEDKATEQSHSVNTSQVWQLLRPCCNQLSHQELEVIKLRYLQEKLPQAVAELLDITRNYANVIANRARRKLRDCLKSLGYKSSGDLL